jgi:type VI secretion system protein ImpG
MSDSLFRYYETELTFIRKLAQEFAAKYPAAAARLQLEPDRSADPHVERLIEAFALLAGRIRHKIDDDFPELTDALLSVIYPHVLAPMPSLATVQFTLAPNRASPDGVVIPKHSPLHSASVNGQYCKFRTTGAVQLWPIKVSEAKLHPPPFPTGLKAPVEANAALRLQLQCTGEVPFHALNISSLRVHLLGENTLTAALYGLILNDAISVAFLDPQQPKNHVTLAAAEVLHPVGFDDAEALLPYPPNVFQGYRLLSEYFAYQPRFLSFELAGWPVVRQQMKPGAIVDVVIFLKQSHPRLEQLTEPGMFRFGCTPVVNLFEQTAEPIPLTHQRTEYRITPAVSQPQGHEIFRIQQVTVAGTQGGDREYAPFYHTRHSDDRKQPVAYWYASRRPSLVNDDRGTDLYLHLVDAGFNPHTARTDDTIVVRTLCTNRDLPTRLPRVGDEVKLELAFASPGATVRCIRNPTAPLRPGEARGRAWRLVSHLNLNHLPFTSDEQGLEALRGLLQLYIPSDPDAEPQAAALARQAVEAIVGFQSKRSATWVGQGELAGMVRGLDIAIKLDEAKFVNQSGLLFASVLEQFFALSVTVNSFTRTTVKFKQSDTPLRRWPARCGERVLV